MHTTTATYQEHLLFRLLDDRPGRRAFLRTNVALGVSLACLFGAYRIHDMLTYISGMACDMSYFYSGWGEITAALGLGYALSVFCGWAHAALQRRIDQDVWQLGRQIDECKALMASPRAAPSRPTKTSRLRLPKRRITRPPWFNFPITLCLLGLLYCSVRPFAGYAGNLWFETPTLQAAPFLDADPHRFTIIVDKNGRECLDPQCDWDRYRTARPPWENHLADLHAAGYRECVILMDKDLPAQAFFKLRSQLQAAGFETLYFGDRYFFGFNIPRPDPATP